MCQPLPSLDSRPICHRSHFPFLARVASRTLLLYYLSSLAMRLFPEDAELETKPTHDNSGVALLYRADPFARFLIDKLRITPVGIGLLSIVISLMLAGVNILSNWSNRTPEMVASSLPLAFAALFLNPIIYGYYLWSFQRAMLITKSLIDDNILIVKELDPITETARSFGRKWHWLVGLAMGTTFGCAMFAQYQYSLTNNTIPLLSPWLIALATLAVVYCGTILVLNLICNVLLLNHILGNASLDINPLHPDHCGGLKALSAYSLQTAYLVGILGIWVGILEYQFIQQHYALGFHVLIPFYVSASMVIFFGPLLAAHKEMQDAKRGLLHKISRKYKLEYEQICLQIDDGADGLKFKAERLEELKSFYDTTDRFPVWPFDVAVLRQYAFTVSTPIISLVLIVFKEMLTAAIRNK